MQNIRQKLRQNKISIVQILTFQSYEIYATRGFQVNFKNIYSIIFGIKKNVLLQRRDGRAVECGGLENHCTARYRGFESLSLRQV